MRTLAFVSLKTIQPEQRWLVVDGNDLLFAGCVALSVAFVLAIGRTAKRGWTLDQSYTFWLFGLSGAGLILLAAVGRVF